jgi:hypothetical protein
MSARYGAGGRNGNGSRAARLVSERRCRICNERRIRSSGHASAARPAVDC